MVFPPPRMQLFTLGCTACSTRLRLNARLREQHLMLERFVKSGANKTGQSCPCLRVRAFFDVMRASRCGTERFSVVMTQ